jgi:hypothetical protein
MRVFEEGGKKIDGVSIDAGTFVFGGMTDCLADVAREVVWLGRRERRGRRVAERRDLFSVKFLDMWEVVWANSGNRLGGAGTRDSRAEVIVVSSELSTTTGVDIRCRRVLLQTFNLHGRIEKEGNVTREGGVDAVTNGGVDGESVTLKFCSRDKNEHVKMEQ